MRIVVVIWTFLVLSCLSSCSDNAAEKNQEHIRNMEIENSEKTKKLRHIVLFKFKETAMESDIAKVETALPMDFCLRLTVKKTEICIYLILTI